MCVVNRYLSPWGPHLLIKETGNRWLTYLYPNTAIHRFQNLLVVDRMDFNQQR